MKKLTKFLTVILAVVLALSVTACKKDNVVDIDENKTQIYVYARNQGLGYEFLTELANRFNAKPENQDYQVVAQWGDDELTSTVAGQLDAGICNYNIYFGAQSKIINMIEQDKLVDLTDVYEMKVDGDDQAIKDKANHYEDFKRIFTKLDGSGGIYAMPFASSVANQMVFDYDFFLERGYLDYAPTSELSAVNATETVAQVQGNKIVVTKAFGNYEVGDFVLTAGKDGKYGTYDDGQKTTVEEFYDLLREMVIKQDNAFIYTTYYAGGYTKNIFTNYLAQYMGLDNFKTFTTYNGEIKGKDGVVQKTITMDNGNEAFSAPIVKEAYLASANFFNDTLLGHLSGEGVTVDKMLHVKTYNNGPTTSLTHTEAQQFFVIDREEDDSTAFLIEGSWWEKEARSVIEGTDGWGEREYRVYLLPTMSGQITPADQTVFYTDEFGAAMIFNNYPEKVKDDATKKAEFMQKCKEFLAYTCSDEACVYYTSVQGLKAAFDYEIPADVLATLTPFQRNCIELLADKEHIKSAVSQTGPDNLMRSYQGVDNTTSTKNNAGYVVPYTPMSGITPIMTPEQYVDGIISKVNDRQEFFSIILPNIWPTLTTYIVTGVTTIFTWSGSLMTFYMYGAPPNVWGLEYYFTVTVKNTGTLEYLNYPMVATAGMFVMVVTLPIVFGVKAIMNKLDKTV